MPTRDADDAEVSPSNGRGEGPRAGDAFARARAALAGRVAGWEQRGWASRKWRSRRGARVEAAVRALADGLEHLSRESERSAASVAAVGYRTDDVADRVRRLERERRAEVRRSGGQAGAEARSEAVGVAEPPESVEPLTPAGYLAFEQRFRGTREEIQQRQRDAIRFVAGLVGGSAPLLDLGAGRGEWLGVLKAAGIPAYGVDTNAEMAGAAVAAGLDVRTVDALTHLDGVPEASLGAVSAFHLVEHVPIAVLSQLLDATYLALQPGGILLLETPNPTNVVVGSSAFYLDPTHLRPLHPHFLQFLVELHGFADVQIHFVHPVDAALSTGTAGPQASRDARVLDAAAYALFGAQDYVVFARRPGSAPARTDA